MIGKAHLQEMIEVMICCFLPNKTKQVKAIVISHILKVYKSKKEIVNFNKFVWYLKNET